MPCTVDISPNEEINHFQVLLCRAFKFLSKEQISEVTNPGSGIYDGLPWYAQHLMNDYSQRCFNSDVLAFVYETTEYEKNAILQELNRIGYDLIINTSSITLVSLEGKKDDN